MHVIQGIHSEKLREAIEKAAESTTEETDYARQYLHMKRKGVNGFIVVVCTSFDCTLSGAQLTVISNI